MAKYGVREICDVVFKAKSTMTVGNKKFYKNEPVIYFDTLKTSSLEGASTTVYAQGGRGNARLMAWDGERTMTFNMEDALISPEGLMILSGAGLIEASTGTKALKQHITETIALEDITSLKSGSGSDASAVNSLTTEGITTLTIPVEYPAYVGNATDGNDGEAFIYVMLVKDEEIVSEPYLAYTAIASTDTSNAKYLDGSAVNTVTVAAATGYAISDKFKSGEFDSVIVDYYTARTSNAKQIEITADSFGGNFYIEASTLFRNQDGADLPAEFVIPNGKVQSNFTFTMSSSGDPSSFPFTVDAFPDYTRFDKTKKVLAAIQIIESVDGDAVDGTRASTNA